MSPWPKDLVHRKLTGVCAGIARRLGVSRVTVRVVAAPLWIEALAGL